MSDILRGESVVSENTEQKERPFVVKHIPLERIRRSEKNKYGLRDIEELAAAIEAVGLMHNILVRETDEPEIYELISGERRYLAYKALWDEGKGKYATIPCKIEAQVDDELAELGLLFANSTARELNDFEKTHQAMRIRALLKSLKEKGYKIQGRINDIIAEAMDVSTAQIGRMTKIHGDLISGFQEEFAQDKIGITAAYDLAVLPQDEQERILAEYRETGPEAIRKATVKASTAAAVVTPPAEQSKPTAPDVQRTVPAAPPRSPVESEPRTADPARANKVQRALLIDFGKEAVQDLAKAEDEEQRARITGCIEAFAAVAGAFGIHDYDAEIHIP
jgi:ParB-like chromosome segregation protein Spo0J